MFTIIVKIILTVFLSLMAGISAAKSIQFASANKRKISKGAFWLIVGMGLISGLVSLILPPAWMIQVIFIITYIVLQLINTEGKHRAACWGYLSALSGFMLLHGLARWQDEIGGIRFWMVITGIIFAFIPIGIGIYRSVKISYFAEEESDRIVSDTVKDFVTRNKKTIAATVFLCLCVAGLITAVVWAVS